MASADVCCRGPVDFHRRLIPGVPAEVGRGRPAISRVPPPTVPACRPPDAEARFEAASPDATPLPWPSPCVERRGAPWSRAGSPHAAAGCTGGDGRLGCPAGSEGDAASAPPVARKPWAPAPWRSGASHGRPDTGAQTVPFKAHQRRVRLTRGPNFGERREYSACTFPRLLERLALCGLNTFDVSPFVY
jgi:hypothetical protein